jgi:hypothetical protein
MDVAPAPSTPPRQAPPAETLARVGRTLLSDIFGLVLAWRGRPAAKIISALHTGSAAVAVRCSTCARNPRIAAGH